MGIAKVVPKERDTPDNCLAVAKNSLHILVDSLIWGQLQLLRDEVIQLCKVGIRWVAHIRLGENVLANGLDKCLGGGDRPIRVILASSGCLGPCFANMFRIKS